MTLGDLMQRPLPLWQGLVLLAGWIVIAWTVSALVAVVFKRGPGGSR